MILINFCKESHRYQSVKQNKSLASFSVCFVKQNNLGIGLRFDLLKSINPFQIVLLSSLRRVNCPFGLHVEHLNHNMRHFEHLVDLCISYEFFLQRTLITFQLLKDLPLVVWLLFIFSLFQWFNVHVFIDKPIFLNHMNVFLIKASIS